MSLLDDLSEKLTLQQKLFCDEYLVSFNAYRAALSAGYSDSTARKAELLHMPRIQDYLKAAMNRTSERLQITHDMILRELAKVAFSNMGSYYDDNGVLKPMNELSEYEKAAICQYQVLDAVDDDGQRMGELSKIKLHNKMSALDKIARHLGFYNGERKTVSSEVHSEQKVVSGELQREQAQNVCVRKEVRTGEITLADMVVVGDNTNNGGDVEVMQDVACSIDPSLHPPVGRESHVADAFYDVANNENMKFVNGELQPDDMRYVCISDNGVGDTVTEEPHPALSKEEGLKILGQTLVDLEKPSAEAKKILTFSPQPPMRIFENRKAKERAPVTFLGKRGNYSFGAAAALQR